MLSGDVLPAPKGHDSNLNPLGSGSRVEGLRLRALGFGGLWFKAWFGFEDAGFPSCFG